MDDQSSVPRILANQPLPASFETKGSKKPRNEQDSSQRATRHNGNKAFVEENLKSQTVPVIIRFSYGYWRDPIPNTDSINLTVGQIKRLRDLFTVINGTQTARSLYEQYGLRFPEHVREVVVEISDQTSTNETTYDHITTQMNTRIWEEEYIERGLQPLLSLYEAGRGPQIEVNVDPHVINHPHEPIPDVLNLDEFLRRPRSH